MRSHLSIKLILLLACLGLFWACTKNQNNSCDISLVPKVTTNSPVIAGDTLQLSVSGICNVYMYNWYGPNGFSSHDSAPSLTGITSANAGSYHVDIITNGGCIYTTKTDSVIVGSPVVACSLATDQASIAGVSSSMYFGGLTFGPNGGSYFIEATSYSADADAEIEFFGNGIPAAGIYSAQPNGGGEWQQGDVHITFTAESSNWYGGPGTVYVSVVNGKLVVSSCSMPLASDTWNFNTTGSFQFTQP
jgi:hypothetical protein